MTKVMSKSWREDLSDVWPWIVGLAVILGACAVFFRLPALLLLALFIGAIVMLRGWPTSGIILLMACSLLSHYKGDVGPVSVRAEHIALLIVGALYAWQVVIHRRAFRLDWPAVFALAWLAMNMIATVANAPNPSDSLRHIVRLAIIVLTYIVASNLLRTPAQWWTAFGAFMGLAVAEDLFGLVARVLYSFGINLGVQVAWVLTEPVPYGTLEEGNMFGSHSASWLILFLALLLARLRTPSTRPGRRGLRDGIWWPLAGAFVCGLAVILSFSRGAWLALLAGLVLLFVFYGRKNRGQYLRATLLVTGGPLAVLCLIAIIQVLPGSVPLAARLRTFTTLVSDATFNSRLGNYYLGVLDWLQHPWLGWGPGSFYQIHGLLNYAEAWLSNQVIRTLQETGVLGMLAYAGFVASLLWATVRAIRQASSRWSRAVLLGLAIGFVVLQVAYQATDGTWLAAMWVHAALLASGARLLISARTSVRDDAPPDPSGQGQVSDSPEATRPMRILFTHSSDELYGSDIVLLELVKRLDPREFSPVVALPADLPYLESGARLSAELAKLQVPVWRLDYAILRRRYLSPSALPAFAMRLWRGSRELAGRIRKDEIDLVHANTVAVIGGALAARLSHRALVWHVHEIIAQPRWLRWTIARIVTGWSDRVVAISRPVAEHLLEYGAVRDARRKTQVIADAVDTERQTPLDAGVLLRQTWGIGRDQVLVGAIGRLHSWKGQGVLVESARQIQAGKTSTLDGNADGAKHEVKFAIIGGIVPGQPEPLLALQKAIGEGGLSETVRLAGFIPDSAAAMAALDILVLPSTSPEPFGLVLIEAMANGKPVIATAHGGPLDIIIDGETGILVPPGDPVALAAAIRRLAADPALRQCMGEAGRARAVAVFGVGPHVDAFERLYRSMDHRHRKDGSSTSVNEAHS